MPDEHTPGDKAPTHFRACRTNVIEVLRQIGAETPELDARLLMSDALGLEGAAYFMQPDRLLSETELKEIAQRLTRRMAGEPVSRILGRREFWKQAFEISPDVLDPRPDSEVLIETALRLIECEGRAGDPLRVLDLGTGSGALLISLLLEWPMATGTGVDIARGAIETAARNALRLGCADRVTWHEGNWLEGLEGAFDVIVCNPPYIRSDDIDALAPEVANFDPRAALDGGADGLDDYRLIIPALRSVLAANGLVLMELGVGQHLAINEWLVGEGLELLHESDKGYYDLSGHIRCVAGRNGEIG